MRYPSRIPSASILACLAREWACLCPRKSSDSTLFGSLARTITHRFYSPSAYMHACMFGSQNKQIKSWIREIGARTLFKVHTIPPASHSHLSNISYPPIHFTIHVSLARISHQLCSIKFYCNCRKFYSLRLFHCPSKIVAMRYAFVG